MLEQINGDRQKSNQRVGNNKNEKMKKIVLKTVELLAGAKIHANHKAIKGQKSGGVRDQNGNDWKKSGNNPSDNM